MTNPRIVMEDDPALRLFQVILDPDCPPERSAAFADYVRHDLSDFLDWRERLRESVPNLFPCEMIVVGDTRAFEAALRSANIAVVEALPVTAGILDKAPNLRLVQKFGMVLSNIDRTACEDRGIRVNLLRRRTNIAVAEHSFALLLMLAKRLQHVVGMVTSERFAAAGAPLRPYDRRHTPQANWGRVGGLRRLEGANLGLLGLGEIGREVARMGRGFEMNVLYTQRNQLDAVTEAELGVTYRPLEALLGESDAISIHLPMNGATRGFVGSDAFAAMKRGTVLINTARAEIVDRDALVDALTSGRLAGAGFDVLYAEPAQEGDPLLALPNFVATPHLAGASRMNGLEDMREMITKIAAAIR